jgi:hypothetical protein
MSTLSKDPLRRLSSHSFFSGPPKIFASFARLSSALDLTTKNNVPADSQLAYMEDIPLDSDRPPPNFARLRRNKTERGRLQGLMHPMNESREEGEEGRVKKTLGRLEKASVWMVNEGKSPFVEVGVRADEIELRIDFQSSFGLFCMLLPLRCLVSIMG